MRLQKPTAEDIAVLGRMRLFAGVPPQSLPAIATHAQIRLVERGELLFERDERADRFFGVMSGWVKVFNNRSDGTEAVLGVFTRGETFAEAALFMSGTYPATAEAVSSSRILAFENDYFSETFLKNPQLCRGMFASLSVHLHRLTQEIEQLHSQTSEQRLARFLVALCAHDSGICKITLPYEKSLIAGRLGMKPETLSRNFKKLQKWGVEVDREDVVIGDVARLREYAS